MDYCTSGKCSCYLRSGSKSQAHNLLTSSNPWLFCRALFMLYLKFENIHPITRYGWFVGTHAVFSATGATALHSAIRSSFTCSYCHLSAVWVLILDNWKLQEDHFCCRAHQPNESGLPENITWCICYSCLISSICFVIVSFAIQAIRLRLTLCGARNILILC